MNPMSTLTPSTKAIWFSYTTNPMISWVKESSSQCGMALTSSTIASEKGHTPLLNLMDNSWRTPATGSTLRDFTLNITNELLHFLFLFFNIFLPQVRGSTISCYSKVTRNQFETPLTPPGSNLYLLMRPLSHV